MSEIVGQGGQLVGGFVAAVAGQGGGEVGEGFGLGEQADLDGVAAVGGQGGVPAAGW
ncbi:hypothetical protein [Streptomyces sp. NPDC002845]